MTAVKMRRLLSYYEHYAEEFSYQHYNAKSGSPSFLFISVCHLFFYFIFFFLFFIEVLQSLFRVFLLWITNYILHMFPSLFYSVLIVIVISINFFLGIKSVLVRLGTHFSHSVFLLLLLMWNNNILLKT